MEKATVQLKLTGTQVFGNLPIPTPLQSVTVEGNGRTFTEAVNDAIRKLSTLLSKAEQL